MEKKFDPKGLPPEEINQTKLTVLVFAALSEEIKEAVGLIPSYFENAEGEDISEKFTLLSVRQIQFTELCDAWSININSHLPLEEINEEVYVGILKNLPEGSIISAQRCNDEMEPTHSYFLKDEQLVPVEEPTKFIRSLKIVPPKDSPSQQP